MANKFSLRLRAQQKTRLAAMAIVAVVASVVAGLLIAPPTVMSALAQTAAPNASSAQADKVAATGVKLTSAVIENYVETSLVPSPDVGKVPRWKDDICPSVTGAGPISTNLLVQRIRAVAAMAGAPVAPLACNPNVEVSFTGAPQVVLDAILKDQPQLVGLARSSDQTRALATVSHPIQAWYATQLEDNNGIVRSNDAQDRCNGISVADVSSSCAVGRSSMDQRTRASDNRKSEFFHVLIIVDTSKIAGVSLDAIADYAAMLALAQPKSFETCQAVPSITNLVSPNCNPEIKTPSLTDIDLAYLRGVYKMKPDRTFNQQQDEIEDEMAKGRAP